MSRKADIKTCRYEKCKHPDKQIDISCEDYTRKGTMYYHKDCYKAKASGEWKDAQTKADLQLIKNMWVENISQTVVFSQLFKMLNDLLSRGISSDYLVFVLQYCIENHLHLNYPGGFPYFVDKREIKAAYEKKLIKAQERMAKEQKPEEKPVAEDNSPTFTAKQKIKSFQDIIKSE